MNAPSRRRTLRRLRGIVLAWGTRIYTFRGIAPGDQRNGLSRADTNPDASVGGLTTLHPMSEVWSYSSGSEGSEPQSADRNYVLDGD